MRPEIVGMQRMQTELDAERDLMMSVTFATIGFIILSFLILLAFLWFMEQAKHYKDSKVISREGHDPDDPYCKFWQGDKAGTNLYATCDPCETKFRAKLNKMLKG